MKTLLSTRFVHQAARVCLILLLVVSTQGSNCGGGNPAPPETHVAPPPGNSPNVMPPANVIPQLIILINNFRATQNLPALVHDPIGDLVANDEVTAWQAAGFPSPFSFDVLGDLQGQGESASQSVDAVAQGYSQAQPLFNALQGINALSGPFTHIGVALINLGAGNDWAIVMY